MEPELVGNRIVKLMEEKKISIEELASQMGLSLEEVKDKLKGKQEFYLQEMIKIKNIFQLDTESCDALFFQETTENKKKAMTK